MSYIRFKILIWMMFLFGQESYAGVYVNLYTDTSMYSSNQTKTYSGINTLNYSTVRMTYTVNLSNAFAGYVAPPFSGSWSSKCNGTTIRAGSNSNNAGAPAPASTTLTDDVSSSCANSSSVSVALATSGWGIGVSLGNLIVQGFKDNPISSTQTAVSTNQNTPTAQTSLAVSDPQNASLSVVVSSGPSNGTLSWSGTKFIYTPNNCFYGTDSFTYYVTESVAGQASTARTITINVAKVNNSPTINTISAVDMPWYQPKTISLSGIAKGTCGGTITVTATSNNLDMVVVPTISYTNPNTTATLTLTPRQPVAKQTNNVTITITVSDGYNTATTRTFNTAVQWVSLQHR